MTKAEMEDVLWYYNYYANRILSVLLLCNL